MKKKVSQPAIPKVSVNDGDLRNAGNLLLALAKANFSDFQLGECLALSEAHEWLKRYHEFVTIALKESKSADRG